MNNFFGLICAGKAPVQFQQVSDREFLSEITEADNVNHIVVFMTGVDVFPQELGAAVYVRWPLPNSQETNWHYLGFVCNGKPSAIFKVAQLHQSEANHSNIFGSQGLCATTGTHGTAQVGIMVESLSSIEEKHLTENTQITQQTLLSEFADKMLRNLVNHAESFAVRLERPDRTGMSDYIPVKSLQDWFTSFSRRFQQNPYFWRTLNN